MIIISDIHGSYKSLKALIKKCPKQEIVIAGDLIDRGNSSKDLVKFIRSEGFKVILGNHELMAIESLQTPMSWLFNGGYNTLASYGIETYPDKLENLDKDFLSYGSSAKNLYLLLLEDL